MQMHDREMTDTVTHRSHTEMLWYGQPKWGIHLLLSQCAVLVSYISFLPSSVGNETSARCLDSRRPTIISVTADGIMSGIKHQLCMAEARGPSVVLP